MNLFERLKLLNFTVIKVSTPRDSLTGVATMIKPDFTCGWEIELCTTKSTTIYAVFGFHYMYKVTGKEKTLVMKIPASVNDEDFLDLVKDILAQEN